MNDPGTKWAGVRGGCDARESQGGRACAGVEERGVFGGTIDMSIHESAHHKMQITKELLGKECKDNIKSWFKKMRNQT